MCPHHFMSCHDTSILMMLRFTDRAKVAAPGGAPKWLECLYWLPAALQIYKQNIYNVQCHSIQHYGFHDIKFQFTSTSSNIITEEYCTVYAAIFN